VDCWLPVSEKAGVLQTCEQVVYLCDSARPRLHYISVDCCATGLLDSQSVSATHPAVYSGLPPVSTTNDIIQFHQYN